MESIRQIPSTPTLDFLPDWSRLNILPASNEQVLVIDQRNGKWVFIPNEATPLVQLLDVDDAHLPPHILERRDLLAEELWDQGLGGPAYATADDLNTVILKLTKACNYACTYCYDMEPEDKVEHLPLELALQVIEEGLELAPRKLGVILHGGEPTLVFSFLKRIVLESEQIAERLVKEILFLGQTNLSRLTAEMVEFFQQHNMFWGISLDGPPELNDRFRIRRNGAGTYQHFERALTDFPDFVRSCGVMSVITRHNDQHLLRIARHFRDLGMASWDWSLFFPIGQGRLQSQLFEFSVDQVLDSWNELFEAVESGEFDGMNVRPVSSYLENFLRGPGGNMCMKKDCGAARDLLSVSSDGTIQACDCIDPQGPNANLGLVQIGESGSLHRARQSERAERIRSRDVTVGKCDTCPWLTLCGGTCGAHAPTLHGIWEAQCRLALLAFARIAHSLATSDHLKRYWHSLHGAP